MEQQINGEQLKVLRTIPIHNWSIIRKQPILRKQKFSSAHCTTNFGKHVHGESRFFISDGQILLVKWDQNQRRDKFESCSRILHFKPCWLHKAGKLGMRLRLCGLIFLDKIINKFWKPIVALYSLLEFFPFQTFEAVSDEQGEMLHRGIAGKGKRDSGKCYKRMLTDYCWALQRETSEREYK